MTGLCVRVDRKGDLEERVAVGVRYVLGRICADLLQSHPRNWLCRQNEPPRQLKVTIKLRNVIDGDTSVGSSGGSCGPFG